MLTSAEGPNESAPYMGGIVRKNGGVTIEIGGAADYVHMPMNIVIRAFGAHYCDNRHNHRISSGASFGVRFAEKPEGHLNQKEKISRYLFLSELQKKRYDFATRAKPALIPLAKKAKAKNTMERKLF